jgi:hypothetical protein
MDGNTDQQPNDESVTVKKSVVWVARVEAPAVKGKSVTSEADAYQTAIGLTTR